ncbi:MAG: M20/M25/M40 family metallo-hydrolase [Melioribacteraceae bacterium]|nr:M20/M25/M40 family metallo-hydrolase [Melioribacteraceae bacterium]
MKYKLIVLAIVLTSLIVVYSQLETDESIVYLKANLEYLASDELEGREATKRGEDLAAMFIASELKKYGVEPFGDSGSYFQKFDVQISSVSKSSAVAFQSGNDKYELNPDTDFIVDRRGFPLQNSSAEMLDIVFANYGIVSEEHEMNDYIDLDVKNKAVVVFDDLPNDEKFSRVDTRKYGTWTAKRKIAIEQGAAALIIILSNEYYNRWDGLHRRMFSESFTLVANEEKDFGLPTLAFSQATFEQFFKDEEFSFEQLSEMKENGENAKSFILNKKLSFYLHEKSEIDKAQNVVGIIIGNNNKLSETFIAVTAHYDHVGVNNGEVYNGADDNGSGTVTILEAARQLALIKQNERSILFVFHTAEEKGLLGSKYLTANAEYTDSIIANINMDMVGRGPENEIYCIGSGKLSSQFYELVKNVNEESVQFSLDYKFDAEDDPNRYYYRSDHYEYAKRNIPVVFFFDEMKEDYHKPTDDVEKINFNKLKKMVKLTAGIALSAANLPARLSIDN